MIDGDEIDLATGALEGSHHAAGGTACAGEEIYDDEWFACAATLEWSSSYREGDDDIREWMF